jgi:hypothetical protein
MPKQILIDESLPRRLKNEFSGFTVSTVPEMGWAGKKNGELLALMSGQFDVFVTADQNLKYQQNLTTISVAIVVLAALKNTLGYLRPLIPQALEQLGDIQPGDVLIIPHPRSKPRQSARDNARMEYRHRDATLRRSSFAKGDIDDHHPPATRRSILWMMLAAPFAAIRRAALTAAATKPPKPPTDAPRSDAPVSQPTTSEAVSQPTDEVAAPEVAATLERRCLRR